MLRAFFFTHIYTDTDICIGRCTVSTLYTLYDELRTLIIINYIIAAFRTSQSLYVHFRQF